MDGRPDIQQVFSDLNLIKLNTNEIKALSTSENINTSDKLIENESLIKERNEETNEGSKTKEKLYQQSEELSNQLSETKPNTAGPKVRESVEIFQKEKDQLQNPLDVLCSQDKPITENDFSEGMIMVFSFL